MMDDEYIMEDCEANAVDLISPNHFVDPRVNAFGDVMDHNFLVDTMVNQASISGLITSPKLGRNNPDFEALCPYFGWMPLKRIQHTFENTTQFYRASTKLPFRHHYKSRFPAANVSRLNEVFATDTFFSSVPAADDGIRGHGGVSMMQLYAGKSSQCLAGYPLRYERDMSHSLEDFIRDYGAPTGLFSDNAKAQTGNAVTQLL